MSCVCWLVILAISITVCLATADSFSIKNHENIGLLPMDECGSNSADRIIGGKKAFLGQYPWLARLGYFNACRNKVTFNCGGVLITDRYILTAGHCSVNLPSVECDGETHKLVLLKVRLGEYDSEEDEDCDEDLCADPVQDIYVEKIISNSNYGRPLFGNDIALLRLQSEAVFNGWVMPICLPTTKAMIKNDYQGRMAEVAGWGTTNVTAKTVSNVLMFVKVAVTDIEECDATYDYKYTLNRKLQLCAGGVKDKDSCTGDSGGPLVIVEDSGDSPRYYALGVTSFGAKDCGTAGKPGVYTRVAGYMKWILDNIEA